MSALAEYIPPELIADEDPKFQKWVFGSLNAPVPNLSESEAIAWMKRLVGPRKRIDWKIAVLLETGERRWGDTYLHAAEALGVGRQALYNAGKIVRAYEQSNLPPTVTLPSIWKLEPLADKRIPQKARDEATLAVIQDKMTSEEVREYAKELPFQYSRGWKMYRFMYSSSGWMPCVSKVPSTPVTLCRNLNSHRPSVLTQPGSISTSSIHSLSPASSHTTPRQ